MQKAEWMAQSWDRGACNPAELAELRTRADAYEALQMTDYGAYCALNGVAPVVGDI